MKLPSSRGTPSSVKGWERSAATPTTERWPAAMVTNTPLTEACLLLSCCRGNASADPVPVAWGCLAAGERASVRWKLGQQLLSASAHTKTRPDFILAVILIILSRQLTLTSALTLTKAAVMQPAGSCSPAGWLRLPRSDTCSKDKKFVPYLQSFDEKIALKTCSMQFNFHGCKDKEVSISIRVNSRRGRC